MRNHTTDLDIIRKNARRFTWGEVLNIHDLHDGKYTIVEYLSELEPQKANFHIYVDGKDTCAGASSFEGAVLLAFAKAHLELNTDRYMAQAAAKILGIPDES